MTLSNIDKLRIDRKENKRYNDTLHRNMINIIYNKDLIKNDNILKYLLKKKELLKNN